MIPISEIQRVIDSLEFEQKIAESRLKEGDPSHLSIGYWNGIDALSKQVIRELKELIPSENDSSRVSGNDQAAEAEQDAEQKDGSRWDNFRQQTRSQLFL